MDKCHECSNIIDKLNTEYQDLFNEKELYRNKCNSKNDLIIEMVKKEYLRVDEIIKKRSGDSNLINYNTYTGQIRENRDFIINLFKEMISNSY